MVTHDIGAAGRAKEVLHLRDGRVAKATTRARPTARTRTRSRTKAET
jgi:ABC-type lipoprotein export system ATPase subunit